MKIMKLQKQTTRKVGNKKYSKWVAVLPAKLIKKLGWKEGDELEASLDEKKLAVEKK